MVAVVPGVYDANADSLRVTIYGKGGHGSAPQTAIDPIVIAARTILTLQTIPSREVRPGEMAVVTVGYIHAGTKNNIIPDNAELGLTVRTYKPEVRKQVLAAIDRIVKAEAAAAGAPREPRIEHYESTDSVYNDPAIADRLKGVLEAALGRQNVIVEGRSPGRKISRFLSSRACPVSTSAWAGPIRQRSPKPNLTAPRSRRTILPSLRRMSIRRFTQGSQQRWRCCGTYCRNRRRTRRHVGYKLRTYTCIDKRSSKR
jgi:metal-dependent amidase/aminoacylase/carboxypeptidase family protein